MGFAATARERNLLCLFEISLLWCLFEKKLFCLNFFFHVLLRLLLNCCWKFGRIVENRKEMKNQLHIWNKFKRLYSTSTSNLIFSFEISKNLYENESFGWMLYPIFSKIYFERVNSAIYIFRTKGIITMSLRHSKSHVPWRIKGERWGQIPVYKNVMKLWNGLAFFEGSFNDESFVSVKVLIFRSEPPSKVYAFYARNWEGKSRAHKNE